LKKSGFIEISKLVDVVEEEEHDHKLLRPFLVPEEEALKGSNDYNNIKIQLDYNNNNFPKHYAIKLGIAKGDFLKCHVEDNRLIVEKVKT
jgi:hypothetical protein